MKKATPNSKEVTGKATSSGGRPMSLSWDPTMSPADKATKEFLALSDDQKWQHMMSLLYLHHPKGQPFGRYDNKRIEWT